MNQRIRSSDHNFPMNLPGGLMKTTFQAHSLPHSTCKMEMVIIMYCPTRLFQGILTAPAPVFISWRVVRVWTSCHQSVPAWHQQPPLAVFYLVVLNGAPSPLACIDLHHTNVGSGDAVTNTVHVHRPGSLPVQPLAYPQ